MSEEIKVGVLVSRGYGAGWSSWNREVDPCNKELVAAFEQEWSDEDKIALATKLYPEAYTGGLLDCVVEYVDKGTLYHIDEYDGYESLETNYNTEWYVAV